MDDIIAGVVGELRRAMPWVAFVAIVALIIGILSFGTFVYSIVAGHPEGPDTGVGPLILMYAPMVVLYIFLALAIGRFALAIAALKNGRTENGLNHTLRLHTQTWRAFGIVIITFVVLGLLSTILF